MAKRTRRWDWAKLGGMAALLGGAVTAQADPTVPQMLAFKPTQATVDISTPTQQQYASCKVELIKGKTKGSGWELKDSNGSLRRFVDSNGDDRIDQWCYFKDGVEVYRELDTNGNGKADQIRWLNNGGSKWAVDTNEDGVIDGWRSISTEEVSQEVLEAVTSGNFAKIQALMITEAEIKALDLQGAEAKRVREAVAAAQKKFEETSSKLKGQKLNWLHLETSLPQAIPASETNGSVDRVVHTRGTILYETNGKSDWLQTGQMVQVGSVWKLTEAPYIGAAINSGGNGSENGGTNIQDNPKLAKLIEELTDLDKKPPQPSATPGPNPELVSYNLKRADLLEKIVAEVKAKDREQWIRQVADSLSTAAQNSAATEKSALDRLTRLEKQIVEAMPGSNLAAYITFREMQAAYAMQLMDKDFEKVQKTWVERLTTFVTTYPKAEDTPDALLQLGMVNEFLGKEVEAKKWYEQLVKDFADKPQGVKGIGAKKRLEAEGKPMELNGSQLGGGTFAMGKIAGKVAVIYYWASWNQQCVGDFAKLKLLLDTYGSKGVEVVCVNLDTTAEEATTFLKRVPAPGIQVHEDNGLESKLATDYGVMVLPHVFLVDKDGKVLSRTVQVNNIEDEVKKLVK